MEATNFELNVTAPLYEYFQAAHVGPLKFLSDNDLDYETRVQELLSTRYAAPLGLERIRADYVAALVRHGYSGQEAGRSFEASFEAYEGLHRPLVRMILAFGGDPEA